MATDCSIPADPGRKVGAYPAFRLLWAATIASNLGTQIQSVSSAWLMTDIGSSTQVALIQSLISMPLMIFALPGGVLADIFERWRLMTLGYGLMACAALLAAVGGLTAAMQPMWLLALCFLFGTGQALFGPTSMSAVSSCVPAALIPAGVASLSVAFNLARCLGPALGGTLVALWGPGWTFACNFVLCLTILGGLLLLIRHSPAASVPVSRISFSRLLIEGLQHLVCNRDMRIIACRIFAFTTCASPIWALLPLVARLQLKGNAVIYGIAMSALGLGALFISFCIRPLLARFSGEWIFRFSASLTALTLVTIPLTHDWRLVSIQLFLAGASWVASLTLLNIASQQTAPPQMVGRAIGLFYSAIFGGLTLGSAIFGRVADITSLGTALLVAGLLALLTLLAGGRWHIPDRPASLQILESTAP